MLARSNISIVRACLAEPSLMGGRTRCTNSSPYITYIHTHYLAHIHDHFSHCHQLHSNLYRDASCVQPLEREFSNFRALSSNLDRQGTFGLCLPTSLLASLQNYNKESIWPKCFYNISPVDRCTTYRNSGDKLPVDPKCVPLYYWTLLVLAANVSICHQVGATKSNKPTDAPPTLFAHPKQIWVFKLQFWAFQKSFLSEPDCQPYFSLWTSPSGCLAIN